MSRSWPLGSLFLLGALLFCAAVWSASWGCAAQTPGEHVAGQPIIHIGSNTEDPGLMETAIVLVISAPFETVREYAADPSHMQNYIAFAAESRTEPLPGGPDSDLLVRVQTTVVEMFGVSVPGKPIALRWHPLEQSDSVFAFAFEQVEGAYEHLSGTIYAADIGDGSTAVMLRTTTRSGFLPEAVREPIARWHAQASIDKLAALLASVSSGG